jgi:hypothetical protein
MSPEPTPPDASRKPGGLLLPVLGAVAASVLVVMLGLVAYRLGEIEERIGFTPPAGLGPGAVLPAELAAQGRAVYVPAYSHIYTRGGEAVQLEVTLSVRNTDARYPIRIDAVRYVDTQGNPIRELSDGSLALGPLQTASYLVEKTDMKGGSGASFIVEWSAKEEINQPIFEAVMIGSGEGVSFTSRGVTIGRHSKD